jgi:iron complex outermembrane receptor protein
MIKKGIIVSISFLLLTAFYLYGKDDRGDEKADIKIIVTASRVEDNTHDVPAYVTVVTAEDIAESGKDTLVDALETLAGIMFRSTTGNEAMAEIAMRGFGENAHGRVLVLLNGRRLNRPDMAGINWLQIPLQDVERVEIVRGGNSVLYGDHAVAGVVNIITRKGADGFDITMSVLGGSFGFNQERMDISGSIDSVTFSLNAEQTSTEGYRERSGFQSIGGGAHVGIDFTDTISTGINVSYNWMNFEMPGDLTKEEMEDDPRQAENTDDDAENQHLNTNMEFNSLFGEWGEVDVNLYYNFNLIKTNMASFASYSDVMINTIGITPQLAVEIDIPLFYNRLITGIDLYWETLHVDRFSEEARQNKTLAATLDKGSAGIYVRNDLSPMEAFIVGAGIRYELALIRAFADLGTALDDEKPHKSLVYDVSVVYHFLDESKIFARYERVYRYPFLDEQVSYYGFGGDQVYTDIEAETGNTADTGIELKLFDRDLTIGTDCFIVQMENEIAFNNETLRNENLEKTLRLGAEVYLSVSLFHKFFEFAGNYTYTSATFLEGENKDKELPLVPNHKAFAELTLNLPYGISFGGSLEVVGDFYQGGDYGNEKDRVTGYSVIDIFLRYHPDYIPGELELFAGIENILDELYTPFVSWDGYYPAPGFSWKIGGTYRY